MGEPPQRQGILISKGVRMARRALHIVANNAVKQLLGSLGSPLIQVAVKGRIAKGAAANTLIIENVSTSRSTTLPIVASQAAKKVLGDVANGNGSHEVSLCGRVVQSAGGNVLLLDGANRATKFAITADASTRRVLADLAEDGGGEMSVRASVVERGGNKVLVLAGEECGKKRK